MWSPREAQEVFDALIPYFTCVAILEQQIDAARQRVVTRQQVREGGRRCEKAARRHEAAGERALCVHVAGGGRVVCPRGRSD